jgi:hypothetical protein
LTVFRPSRLFELLAKIACRYFSLGPPFEHVVADLGWLQSDIHHGERFDAMTRERYCDSMDSVLVSPNAVFKGFRKM